MRRARSNCCCAFAACANSYERMKALSSSTNTMLFSMEERSRSQLRPESTLQGASQLTVTPLLAPSSS